MEGLVLIIDSEDGFTGPMNLVIPGEFTILELARAVIEATS